MKITYLCTISHKTYSPLRHILLVPSATLEKYDLKPGDLKESMGVDEEIHQLPSGTLLRIGSMEVRLTFHCEPCYKVPAVREHERGYLGSIVKQGIVRVGDPIVIFGQMGAIPYSVKDRVKWYLDRTPGTIRAKDLLFEIGAPPGYARALPRMLKGYEGRVVFG
jgi:hypothetical protein